MDGLNKAKNKQNITLILVGYDDISIKDRFDSDVISTGYIRDENKLASIYSAADIALLPGTASIATAVYSLGEGPQEYS